MMRASRIRMSVVCAAVALGSAACAGFSLQELPPEPIALIHRTSDEAKKRAELLDPRARPVARPGRSVLRYQQVEGYLGALAGETEQDRLVDTIGRLALLYPHTGEIVPLNAAQRGSRPLDWSPDHSRLYFSALRTNVPQVFSYEVATGMVNRVTSGSDAHGFASIGPDGRLAYAQVVGTSQKPRSRIWLRDRVGTKRPLTEGPSDYRPRFSPAGSAILYSAYLPTGAPGIFRVDPDVPGPPRLVARGLDPDFAPDGSWVVFSQKIKRRWQIWRMKPDGTGKYAIGGASSTVEKLDALNPTVSPDGRYIVYVSEELGRQQLRVRRADGSGDRPLLEGADAGNPVW
jgi:Tol biopolymer transport system component